MERVNLCAWAEFGSPKLTSKSNRVPHHDRRSGPSIIGFDSENGNIEINWDVSVPFITIPISHSEHSSGGVPPLFKINTKALGVAGLVTTVAALTAPLFANSLEPHYRSNRKADWTDYASEAFSNMIPHSSFIGPCMQYVICSAISASARSENPSSTEKILDGLSSNKWFSQAINGTAVEEAVLVGRDGSRDCSAVYKNCSVNPRLLQNIMSQLGIA
ncbi:uncharacterized protein [Prorops nasuta]|uniref:uncharacterized protein isoform X2 n=1 Tax=Prorops nasuta TaxID=863751 RepID=UPI0034CF953B